MSLKRKKPNSVDARITEQEEENSAALRASPLTLAHETIMVTPLHFAAQKGDVSEVLRLIKSGTDANVRDQYGNTPLKYASAEPYPDVMRALISLGALASLPDHRGFTPIHCVAGHGFHDEAIEMADILINAGADANARSIDLGFVPLHEVRSIRMIDFLIRNGADPTIKNDDGQTPQEYLKEDDRLEESEYLRQLNTNG